MATSSALQVSDAFKASLPKVYQADLLPINFTPVGVQEEASAVTFRDAAMTHAQQPGKVGSIAFVVRRPG